MQIQDSLREHLAAIVEGSDDAIVTKTLDSIIKSWNPGAELLFGYSAEEAIGQSIHMLIPDDLKYEEDEFISRLRRGERIRHFETIRRRKSGDVVPVSLTVSPVRNRAGEIVAASKIARDCTFQKEAAERQRAALAEMMHRVRNCFAVASGLVGSCAREATTAAELAELLRGRFVALASIQSLAIPNPEVPISDGTTLWALLGTVIKPFVGQRAPRFEGENIPVCHAAMAPLALIFYELCTNALKYGAFGQESGALSVSAISTGNRLLIRWEETGDFAPTHGEAPGGFGTGMCEGVIGRALDGNFRRLAMDGSMTAVLDLDLAKVTGVATKQ